MEPFSAAAAAVPAIYNLITGFNQKRKGQQLLDSLERPEYRRPADVDAMLALAKSEYGDQRFAGQTQYENRAAQNQANALQAASDFGNPMHLLANVLAQGNQAGQQIATMQEQTQRQDLAGLNAQAQNVAQYKDTEWQMNKFAPYSEKYNEGREMVGAGQYNQATGLQGLSDVAVGMMSTMKPKATQYEVAQVAQPAISQNAAQNQNTTWMDTLAKMMLGATNQGMNIYKGPGVPQMKW